MTDCIVKDLIDSCNINCDLVSSLALDYIAEVEIPVINRISTLTKHEIYNFLKYTTANLNKFEYHERGLMLTLLMDVVTCVVKEYVFFAIHSNAKKFNIRKLIGTVGHTNILRNIFLKDSCNIKDEELELLELDFKLMAKYAKRVTPAQYPLESNICLLQQSVSKISIKKARDKKIRLNKEVRDMKNSKGNILVDSNKNILSENKLNNKKVKSKVVEYKAIPILLLKEKNKTIVTKKNSKENLISLLKNKNNEMGVAKKISKANSLLKKKSKETELTEKKEKKQNAFQIMMSASKEKSKKPLVSLRTNK